MSNVQLTTELKTLPSAMTIVITDKDLVRKILQNLETPELGKIRPTSILFNQESISELLSRRQPFLDVLKILKDDNFISKKLFNRIRKKNTFLKSPNPIGCETFLKYQSKFREIATKIKTMIETLQNTTLEIGIDKMNNLKNILLKSLILKPDLIGKIDLDKVRFYKTSNFYYLGEIENKRKHGQGTGIFASGDRYEGEFKDNLRHGQGTYIWSNGNRYEGGWVDGEQHGQGTFTDSIGNRYEGGWKNSTQHGQGTLSDIDGNVIYDGKWENGQFIV